VCHILHCGSYWLVLDHGIKSRLHCEARDKLCHATMACDCIYSLLAIATCGCALCTRVVGSGISKVINWGDLIYATRIFRNVSEQPAADADCGSVTEPQSVLSSSQATSLANDHLDMIHL
jgi:hypothetical protein